MDGCGGPAKGYGAPELVTCGRDGCVRVWDVRQHEAPVAAFEPSDTENIRRASMTSLVRGNLPELRKDKVALD